jgi:hypothetical protein
MGEEAYTDKIIELLNKLSDSLAVNIDCEEADEDGDDESSMSSADDYYNI